MIETTPLDDRHMHDLLDIAQTFVGESGWGWTYSESNSQEQFERYIDSPMADVIGVFVNRRLAGCALVVSGQEFVMEEVCFLAKFYIHSWARGTQAARALARAVVEWADEMQSDAIFATATANIGEGKAFENLLAKQGFRAAGQTMVHPMESSDG